MLGDQSFTSTFGRPFNQLEYLTKFPFTTLRNRSVTPAHYNVGNQREIKMAGKQIFAIGDIHGRADLLGPLLDHIEGIAAHGNQDYRIIFLGDIMDRGESSRQAMDLVVDTMTRKPDTVFIRGNHD